MIVFRKILYGAIFCAGIPALIVWGAMVLEPVVPLALPPWPHWSAPAIAGVGTVIMLLGMLSLIRQGGGLPMNGFPPLRLVSNGIYSILPHPIYCGAVIFCGGTALWAQSRSGFYLFTPLVAAGTLTILWGYERIDMVRRFGKAGNLTWFGVPPLTELHLPLFRRFGVGLFPLFVSGCADFSSWKLWTVNLAVFIGLLCMKNCRTTALFICKWLIASVFVVAWRTLFGTYDLWIAAVFLNVVLIGFGGKILFLICRGVEIICNSYRSWRVGPLRIINHAIFTFAAAAGGFYAADILSGGDALPTLFLIAFCSLLGGALWAQLIEGSPRLLRPFGYYGAIFGALAGIGICAIWMPMQKLWILFAALAAVAPWTQAIGRLRCMVQGCCHGRPVENAEFFTCGIRHSNPSSRVCKFTEYIHRPLHSAQLYSIALNLPIGFLLLTLWHRQAAAGLIIGLYFILTGMARFVEEAWRGEPQTRRFWRLTEYQWLCILFVLIAFLIWSVPGPMIPVTLPEWGGWFHLATAAAIGLLYVFAMSMDFPNSNRRFSRLSG